MLATVEDVKKCLMDDQNVDETLIEDLIKSVGDLAEKIANRKLIYGTYTEKFDGKDNVFLYLDGYPIESIVSIKINGEVVDSNAYQVNLDAGEIYYPSGFPVGFQNIEVEYITGYDVNQAGKEPPDMMRRAVIDEVVMRYEYYKSENVAGENYVDAKKDFFVKSSKDYFESLRRINV